MPAIGIDFGGSRLRVAAASPGASGASAGFSLLRHSYASERMPFLAAWEPAEAKSAPRRFQIDALKRLLDFDSSVYDHAERAFPASRPAWKKRPPFNLIRETSTI